MPTPSNGIGSFIIGRSAIGTLPLLDFNTTIISQYANSPILYQLIQNMSEYFNQEQNADAFFANVWNIDTAVGPALDIWGRVVGVERVLPVISVGVFFGFHEMGEAYASNFGNAPFYSGQPTTSNYALSDDAYRQLILAKAAANLSDCSIPSLNQLLLSLFPNRGKCFVTDGLNMTMTYTFQFALTLVEQSIVVNSGVLPRPSGVKVSYSY